MSSRQISDYQEKRLSRRTAIKAGGIAVIGLAFSKPLIDTIRPGTPAYGAYNNYVKDTRPRWVGFTFPAPPPNEPAKS